MTDAPERIWARPDYNECWPKRLEEEDVEYVRADLYDHLRRDRDQWMVDCEEFRRERDAALAGAVKVKPLVWVDMISRMKCEAETAVGRYAIAQDGAWIALWFNGSRMGGALPGIKAAKAAAQADYDARILATLQPDPDARQADLAKAFCMGRDAAAGAAKHAGLAFGYERAVQAILAVTPPADLAAKIGGAE